MALMPSQCPAKTDSKFCPCWQTGVGVGRRLPQNTGQGTSIQVSMTPLSGFEWQKHYRREGAGVSSLQELFGLTQK